MKLEFEWMLPTKIIFRRGCIRDIANYSQNIGKKALILSGISSMSRFGFLKKISDSLKEHSIEYDVYNKILPGPEAQQINQASEFATRKKVDHIIALGGGTVLDAAKATALLLGMGENDISKYIGKTLTDKHKSLPLIAIPTTAGTGSEVTKGAIIYDPVKKFKSGIRGEVLYPNLALIDPELSLTMPIHLARQTAFDSFTHAFETYIARKASPLSDIFAEKSFQLLSSSLPTLFSNKQNTAVEDHLCFAAFLGGMNIANCGSCLPHRFEQAMSGCYLKYVSHPQGLAIVYKSWLSQVYPYAKDKLDRVAKFFRYDSVFKLLDTLIDQLKMNQNLSNIGFKKKHIPLIIHRISGNTANDPIEIIDNKLFKKILVDSY